MTVIPLASVPTGPVPGIVGQSRPMRDVLALVRAAAASDITVLLEGETGTGKELIARAIAELGPRGGRPFVAINCGALAEGLLDAELFGHRQGAFTGADGDRRGLLESGQGGTVFLDEITSMSPSFQAKLLRVLENAEIKAVGCDRARRVDLRIIAASNQRLEERVRTGEFRADLFYRLSVFPITLPPLRERRDDIPLLVDHFLAGARRAGATAVAGMTAEALDRLLRCEYPGNLRQLRNEIARAATLARACPLIGIEHLSPGLRAASASPAPVAVSVQRPALHERRTDAMADIDRRLVCEALERHGYNLSRAAEALRLSRFGLRKRMRRLGIAVRRSLASPDVQSARLSEVG